VIYQHWSSLTVAENISITGVVDAFGNMRTVVEIQRLKIQFEIKLNHLKVRRSSRADRRLWWSSGFACWPLVPEFAGSNPAETVGFFSVYKILSMPSFGGEVK
jgi:hypothetical protein